MSRPDRAPTPVVVAAVLVALAGLGAAVNLASATSAGGYTAAGIVAVLAVATAWGLVRRSWLARSLSVVLAALRAVTGVATGVEDLSSGLGLIAAVAVVVLILAPVSSREWFARTATAAR